MLNTGNDKKKQNIIKNKKSIEKNLFCDKIIDGIKQMRGGEMMRRTVKIALFSTVALAALLLVPGTSKAADIEVATGDDLVAAVNSAATNDSITLTASVEIKSPIEVSGKTITINGAGYTIGAAEELSSVAGSNKSIVTASGEGANVYLTGVTLENSPKYGVQAYDGGYVQLDGVTIRNCAYGAVLVNAGTIEINQLSLESNGANDDNGIEISKSKSIVSDNQPTIIMGSNSNITANNQTNVVRIAEDENDATTEVVIENSEYASQKMSVKDGKIVVADHTGTILYESNAKEGVELSGDEYKVSYKVTLNVNVDGTVGTTTIYVEEGTVLTSDFINAEIPFEKYGISRDSVTGYYTDAKFTNELDLTKGITADTDVYVKLTSDTETPSEEPGTSTEDPDAEKPNTEEPAQGGDNTEEEIENPKTGDNLFVYIATGVVAIVALGVVLKIKKFNK